MKGIAACGLALCEKTNKEHNINCATECFMKARAIVMAPGVVKRALFFFDECAKADEQGILSDVRGAVEGLK